MLGIYSCQNKYNQYIPEYNQTDIRDMIPKYANISLEPAFILSTNREFEKNALSFNFYPSK